MSNEIKSMLTLEPDKQEAPSMGEIPSLQTVTVQESLPSDIAAGAIDESMLTDEEKKMVEAVTIKPHR